MLRTRAQLEAQEDASLAPYAMRAARSRGRAHPDQESAHRTAYQKDRDRVLHTGAFRRLEYKTQVFANDTGDYYRTRLTHTLEVVQVACSMARALGANEDLTATVALAHDLGHPPFGHAGERVLDALMVGHGGFDHNAQSLRIVTLLERRYKDFLGLNLTWESLEGLSKHNLGAAQSAGYAPQLWPTLEAQLANFADASAYTVHDLDDGLRSGLLQASQLNALALWRVHAQRLGITNVGDLERHSMMRELMGAVITDVLHETSRRLQTWNVASVEGVRNAPNEAVAHSADVAAQLEETQAFLHQHFYRHERVEAQMREATSDLRELFAAYLHNPNALPETTQAQTARWPLARVVCDYIAGMTDRFAQDEHRRLCR